MAQPERFYQSAPVGWKYGIEYLELLKDTFVWNKDEKILDVGCGPGNFTSDVLLSYLPDESTLVGTDKSKIMVDYANSNFRNSPVIFKEMDIESTEMWDSWEKESFTRIFCFHVFHWIVNYRKAVENIYSLLKPGGEIYLVYFAEHPCFQLFLDIRNSDIWKKFIKGTVFFEWYPNTTAEDRRKKIFEELKSAGFQDIEVNMNDGINLYSSVEHYQNILHSLDPYRCYIPDTLITEYNHYFEEKVKNSLSKHPENGQPVLYIKWFSIRAKKL